MDNIRRGSQERNLVQGQLLGGKEVEIIEFKEGNFLVKVNVSEALKIIASFLDFFIKLMIVVIWLLLVLAIFFGRIVYAILSFFRWNPWENYEKRY